MILRSAAVSSTSRAAGPFVASEPLGGIWLARPCEADRPGTGAEGPAGTGDGPAGAAGPLPKGPCSPIAPGWGRAWCGPLLEAAPCDDPARAVPGAAPAEPGNPGRCAVDS